MKILKFQQTIFDSVDALVHRYSSQQDRYLISVLDDFTTLRDVDEEHKFEGKFIEIWITNIMGTSKCPMIGNRKNLEKRFKEEVDSEVSDAKIIEYLSQHPEINDDPKFEDIVKQMRTYKTVYPEVTVIDIDKEVILEIIHSAKVFQEILTAMTKTCDKFEKK
jgi:hypothetical protein